MSVKFSPIGNGTNWIPGSGLIANGYKLFFYAAGTTTKQNTYTTYAGSIANSNPITLNAYGRSATEIWLTEGQSYKVVIASGTDTDPPASGVTLGDYITGINDSGDLSLDQWALYGAQPTYISTTSFSVAGDQTALLHIGRRLKTTNTGGTIYSTITNSVYGSVTTITVVNDSGTLDSGLSAVNYGILTSVNPSVPKILLPDGSAAVTQSLGDNSTKIATTAYARKTASSYAAIVSVTTTPYTLLYADFGSLHLCSGSAAAITMTAIAEASIGDGVNIVNQLGTAVTITADGTSTFAGVNGSTTIVSLSAYSSVSIVKSAAGVWSVTDFVGSASQRVLASGNFTATDSLSFVLSTLDATQLATNSYKLVMIGFQPADTDKELYATISSDGGQNYLAGTGYYGELYGLDSSNTARSASSAGTAFWRVAGASGATESLSSAANKTACATYILNNFNTGTSVFPHMSMDVNYWLDSTTIYGFQKGAASNNGTAADIDAIKFTWESSGDFAAVGSYVLYKIA
jgi:hypothetical protein